MGALAFKLSVFVLNPKIFLELAPLLKRYRIKFRVPMELKELCFNDEALVVDAEGMEFIKRSGVSVNVCREVIAVDSVEEARSAVLSRVFGGLYIISIGIDLGKRIAYAVLAGGDVLSYGYIDNLESVLEIVEKLGITEPKVVLVGIGAEYLRSLPSEVYSLVESEKVTATYIIEEERTNEALLPKLAEEFENLPKDFRAAIAIATKVYEKYLLSHERL